MQEKGFRGGDGDQEVLDPSRAGADEEKFNEGKELCRYLPGRDDCGGPGAAPATVADELDLEGSLDEGLDPGIVVGYWLVAEARQQFRGRPPEPVAAGSLRRRERRSRRVGGEAVLQGEVQGVDEHRPAADQKPMGEEADPAQFLEKLAHLGRERVPIKGDFHFISPPCGRGERGRSGRAGWRFKKSSSRTMSLNIRLNRQT